MNTKNTQNRRNDASSDAHPDTSGNRARTRLVIFTLLLTSLVALGGLWFVYADDNTFDSSEARSEDRGQLAINIPRIETNEFFLYVDDQQYRVNPDDETFSQNIAPGEHEIILSAPNHWPWSKNITIEQGETLDISPFLIRKNLSSNIYRFTREPEEYQNLNQQLQAENAKTTAVSSDGSVELDFTASTVTATYQGEGEAPAFFCESVESQQPCPRTKTVFSGQPILDAEFYGDRNDVFAFGVPAGVYVTEISEKKPKSLQPVYEGALGAMAFIDGTAYLQDNEAENVIIEIPLFQPEQADASESTQNGTTTTTEDTEAPAGSNTPAPQPAQ